MAERLFSTHQIADLLGEPASTVRQWMERGWLGHQRLPEGAVRVPESALIRFLKDRNIDIEGILARCVLQHRPDDAATTVASPARRQLPAATAVAVAAPPQARVADAEAVAADSQTDATDSASAGDTGVYIDFPPPQPPQRQHAPAVSTEPASEGAPDARAPAASVAGRPASRQGERARPRRAAPSLAAGSGEAADQVISAVLKDALRRGAQAVHIEFRRQRLELSLRLDGFVHPRRQFGQRLPAGLAEAVAERLLELSDAGRQGDVGRVGRLVMDIDGDPRAFTLAAVELPAGGRRVTVHLPVDVPASLQQAGVPGSLAARLAQAASASGLVLLAGAAGEPAPRWTLNAMLAKAAEAGRTVVSAACRRAEYPAADLDGVLSDNVVEMDPSKATEAGDVARAMYHLDADVLGFEDLPAPAAAQAAVRAALDGRTVLACVAAASAHQAVQGLLELGAEPVAVGRALRGLLVTRTVRLLCPHCRKSDCPQVATVQALDLGGDDLPSEVPLPVGCRECSSTGYRGRAGLCDWREARSVSTMRAALLGSAAPQPAADGGGDDQALIRAGLELVRAGQTSLEELARALGRAD